MKEKIQEKYRQKIKLRMDVGKKKIKRKKGEIKVKRKDENNEYFKLRK